jgi:hypothetical protein
MVNAPPPPVEDDTGDATDVLLVAVLFEVTKSVVVELAAAVDF